MHSVHHLFLRIPCCFALLMAGLFAHPAWAQNTLPGEFTDIELGRPLLEPDRFPTVQEIRALVRNPQLTPVVTFKLHGDQNNHRLPSWSPDGLRLAFQRSEVNAKSSKLLLLPTLSAEKPTLLSPPGDVYDYMFRWGVNNTTGSFAFARILPDQGHTHIFLSTDGEKVQQHTQGAGRFQHPALYERTDGIWQLIYEREGQLLLDAWNSQGPVESGISLGRGASSLWSIDGVRLLLSRERARTGRLTSFDMVILSRRDGTGQVLPAQATDTVRSPSWSPDEQRVAYFVRAAGDVAPWRIQIVSASGGSPTMIGDDVMVNPDFESEGPSWEPSGQRLWYFSHAQREGAYYPLVATDLETGKTQTIHYTKRCTTPSDLAVNPAAKAPEMVFVGHEARFICCHS